jgi:KaiC/GvpD/RAD55 family RecA-like ATPase
MATPIYDHHHAVKFYGDEGHLCSTVAAFLAQGFVDQHPGIVIATPAHTIAVLEELKGRMIDVAKAQKSGDLIVLDAQRTLDLFMDDDMPDAHRFEDSVGKLVADILDARPERTLIRAYGEMVDVLWKDGKPEAAIRLEILWNKLANQYGFALLCGYSMGNFYKQTALFEQVCKQHTHVMPAEVPKAAPVAKSRLH